MSNMPDGFDEPAFGRGPDRSQHQRYVLGSSVLLTAVLCLVFVIVLITALHLYVRFLLRRQRVQRRRARAQLHRAGAHEHHQLQRPKTGLDPAAVAAIPKFTYRKKDQDRDQDQSEAGGSEDCSVCLSQLEEGETVRQLPACGHAFHDTCIDMWLYSHKTCPLCRKVVGPVAGDDPPQASPAAIEVVVVVQVGGGGLGDHDSSRPALVAQSSHTLMPTPAGCGGSQGESGRETGSSVDAPSRLSSFRRMFSLERGGGRRQPEQGDVDGPHRDLERQ